MKTLLCRWLIRKMWRFWINRPAKTRKLYGGDGQFLNFLSLNTSTDYVP